MPRQSRCHDSGKRKRLAYQANTLMMKLYFSEDFNFEKIFDLSQLIQLSLLIHDANSSAPVDGNHHRAQLLGNAIILKVCDPRSF